MWRDPLDELIADLDRVIEPEPPDYGVPSYDVWQLWFERLFQGTEAETAATLRDPSFKAFEKRYPGWMGQRRRPESS